MNKHNVDANMTSSSKLRNFVLFLTIAISFPSLSFSQCPTNHDNELLYTESSLDIFQFTLNRDESPNSYLLPVKVETERDFPLLVYSADPNKQSCLSGNVRWTFDDTCPKADSFGQPWAAGQPINVPFGIKTMLFTTDFDPSGDASTLSCQLDICAGPRCSVSLTPLANYCSVPSYQSCAAARAECTDPNACQCILDYHTCVEAAGCYLGNLADDIQTTCAAAGGACACPARPAPPSSDSGGTAGSNASNSSGSGSGGDGDKQFFEPGSPFFAAFIGAVIVVSLCIVLTLVLLVFCLCRASRRKDSRRERNHSRRYTAAATHSARRRRATSHRSRRGSGRLSAVNPDEDSQELPAVNHTCSICGNAYADQSDLLMHVGLRHPDIAKDRQNLTRTITSPSLSTSQGSGAAALDGALSSGYGARESNQSVTSPYA